MSPTSAQVPVVGVDEARAMETGSARAVADARVKAAKIVATVMAPLILALAILGGLGSFTTVREMAEPHFGRLAWIVPVGMDLGILILLAWDLLMEYLDLPWPVLRWVAWTYIAATVLVNVAAARGDLAGSVMNAAMPVLFITVMEGVRHLIRRWVGLASGSRIERVPSARWLLAPVSSLLLWRRMVLWHITAYRQGVDLEYRHLLAVSELQRQYGRWSWRWRAPLAERLSLRHLPAEKLEATGERLAVDEVENEAACAGSFCGDEKLVKAARQVVRDAQQEGAKLNRVMLGRHLRELGFTIANDRLGPLFAAVQDERPEQVQP
ncbi:DUF2637 domain-containing protein [Actinomadura fibrosa]|uniref:DUF2637 domain-containing protein n=1 Tax=Actinomadura fibrosa TaxID=111802 RepID=A0ABW2XXD1_9ACTN|nr:DUF2637 domain-containing protein [Actinomadura fibrosa]